LRAGEVGAELRYFEIEPGGIRRWSGTTTSIRDDHSRRGALPRRDAVYPLAVNDLVMCRR